MKTLDRFFFILSHVIYLVSVVVYIVSSFDESVDGTRGMAAAAFGVGVGAWVAKQDKDLWPTTTSHQADLQSRFRDDE